MCRSKQDIPELTTVITLYENSSFITVRVELKNTTRHKFELVDVYPIRIDSDRGGRMSLGDNTDSYQALITGPYSLSKKYCLVTNSSKAIEQGWSAERLGMNSIWNSSAKTGILAGFLTSNQSLNSIFLSCDTQPEESSAQQGTFELATRCQYSRMLPSPPNWIEEPICDNRDNNRFVLVPGRHIHSDLAMISFGDHPLDLLEEYGDCCALINDVSLTEEIPAGWCSWYGLERNVDEQIILKNLDYITQNLVDYGVSCFQIDDAWQVCDGDWTPDPKKFPHGMKWLADQIHSHKLKAGI